MGHTTGYRRGTRYLFSRSFRKRGPIHLSTYLKVYKRGDIVDIKVRRVACARAHAERSLVHLCCTLGVFLLQCIYCYSSILPAVCGALYVLVTCLFSALLSAAVLLYMMCVLLRVQGNGSIQKGMPHKFYHGKTGRVFNVTKHAVGVIMNKQIR